MPGNIPMVHHYALPQEVEPLEINNTVVVQQ
jgi:hypothetical protein